MNKKKRTYRVILIPERDGNKTHSFQISSFWITALFTGMAMVLAVTVFFMYKTVQIARNIHYYNTLKSDNEQLIIENNRLQLIHAKIRHMDSIAAYLEKLSVVTNPRTDNTADASFASIDANKSKAEKTVLVEKTPDSIVHVSPSLLPVDGWVTQKFTKDTTPEGAVHPGIDIAAPAGQAIRAPAAGVVDAVLEDALYGTMVVLRHEDGFVTRFGHCEKAMVLPLEKVARGQTIAHVGNTGRSTAPHVHYEVIKDGENVDPQLYIKQVKKKAE